MRARGYYGTATYGSATSIYEQVRLVSAPSACVVPFSATIGWLPSEPESGDMVVFTGSASGDTPVDYTWNLGDGSIKSGAVVSHTYAAVGEYSIVMTATNACGAAVAHDTVVVSETPMVRTYLPLLVRGK